MPNATLIKRPTEQRTYSVNFGNMPEIRDQGQTLSTPVVTQVLVVPSTASSLTISVPTISADLRQVVFTLSAGTDGAFYALRVTAILLSSSVPTGNSLEEDVYLQVSSVT